MRNVLEMKKDIYNMVIWPILASRITKNWKKAKPAHWVPFWNNRLHLLTKIFMSSKRSKSPLQNLNFGFFISLILVEISYFLFHNTAISRFQITTFKYSFLFKTGFKFIPDFKLVQWTEKKSAIKYFTLISWVFIRSSSYL